MEETIQAYINAYNAKDIPALLALLDDQIFFENISNSSGITQTTSKQAFEQLALQSADYVAERKQVVRFMVVSATAAAVEIDYSATLATDLPNGLKAGDTIRLRGVSIFEMKHKKFTRISDYS
ncbi:nuclear transport factor 2 family protein [Spirosoma oryzicola]|uniref:nuclear transport factor 2 family protein n=1 Tax=Spirosoma oryzicola TaxID=2898794 RepID=UPI001E2D2AE7|nr:nuclear transport factor 2 family protein [Spirosoma oryzicola]UHG89779.1 nuclear transport factor 2 family protein [Spirosoma oryzicola]